MDAEQPKHVASCPWCLSTRGEILETPVRQCRDCEAGEKQHLGSHSVKVAWFLCRGCNLAYSGTADEFESERSRRNSPEAQARAKAAAEAATSLEIEARRFAGKIPAQNFALLHQSIGRAADGLDLDRHLAAEATASDAAKVHDYLMDEDRWDAAQ